MPPIFKSSVKFGAIGAGVIAFIFLAYYVLGSNPLIEMDMIDVFILPIFLFFGIKEYRERYNNQLLEFWQGMTVGFFVYTTMATVSAVFIWIFIDAIDVSLTENFVSDRLASLHEIKNKIIEEMGQDSFAETVREVGNTSSIDVAMDGFLKKLVIGFLLTSVISVIMKRKSEK
ncbi:MAG: DUF4199 domain-containing protein [Reichenbachiella sp.]